MKNLSLCALALMLSIASLHAANPPSAPPHVTTVSWILDTRHNISVDDKRVTLVGKVGKKDNGSDWWFSDGTGWVRLDTVDMDLPVGQKLIIHGRIDQSRFGIGYLEVEVKHWNYAPKSK